jgi:hypothetical protein
MAVRLHRCSNMWVKIEAHPCWKVQKALDAAGVDYVVVKGPVRRAKRTELERLSGQRLYPVIEFEDGSLYREPSAKMVARIGAGTLTEARGAPSSGAAPDAPASDQPFEPGSAPVDEGPDETT